MHRHTTPQWLTAVCLGLLSFLSSCAPPAIQRDNLRTGIVDADDPDIQYMGRFDFSDPKRVEFDWPGVIIGARFEGTRCSLRLNDRVNEYEVIVDSGAPRLLTPDSMDVRLVASGLSGSFPHTITIQKRTEPLVGKGEFLGFVLDPGKRLLPATPRPARRIEFIGNSITSAYGVEGASPDCHFTPQTENAALSYAAMSARALHADYAMISYSGRGVVRNYGDVRTVSADPMPALYDRTCFFDSARKWDFSRWIPQVVVINLGTNDYSTQPSPDSSVFEDAYHRLIGSVRSHYAGVAIFCVGGPMIEEPCTRYVRQVVEGEQAREGREKDVFFVEIKKSMLNDGEWGCDHHPNLFGMERMASVLVPAIALRMRW